MIVLVQQLDIKAWQLCHSNVAHREPNACLSQVMSAKKAQSGRLAGDVTTTSRPSASQPVAAPPPHKAPTPNEQPSNNTSCQLPPTLQTDTKGGASTVPMQIQPSLNQQGLSSQSVDRPAIGPSRSETQAFGLSAETARIPSYDLSQVDTAAPSNEVAGSLGSSGHQSGNLHNTEAAPSRSQELLHLQPQYHAGIIPQLLQA